ARVFLPAGRSTGHADGGTRGEHGDGRGSAQRAAGGRAGGAVSPVRRGAAGASVGGGGGEATSPGAVRDERRPHGGDAGCSRAADGRPGQGGDLPGATDRGERGAGGAGAGAPGVAGPARAGRGAGGAELSLPGGPAGEGSVPGVEPALCVSAGAPGMPVSGAGVGPGVDAGAGVGGGGGSGGDPPGGERAAAGVGEGGVMRGRSGVSSATPAIAALLGSRSLTGGRQGRALELLRALDELRSERAVVEAERTELMRRIGYLESRGRSEEHTSELQSRENLVCRLLLEKKNIRQKETRGSRMNT